MHTTAPRQKPAFYVEPAALAAQVRQYRRSRPRVITNELAASLTRIAGGVWDRYRFTADRDEFIGDVFLHLMQRPLQRADPKKNLFSYFTTCVVHYGLNARDKANTERRRFEAYAADVVASGRPIERVDTTPTLEELLCDLSD